MTNDEDIWRWWRWCFFDLAIDPVGLADENSGGIAERLMSHASTVGLQKFETKQASKRDFSMMSKAIDAIRETRLHVRDRTRLTIDRLRMNARRLVRTQGVKVIAVDYLQLMAGPRGMDRRLQIAEITAGCKAIAL